MGNGALEQSTAFLNVERSCGGKRWRPRLGGALELYALDARTGEVQPSPVDALAPEFGTLVLFAVRPGISCGSRMRTSRSARGARGAA